MNYESEFMEHCEVLKTGICEKLFLGLGCIGQPFNLKAHIFFDLIWILLIIRTKHYFFHIALYTFLTDSLI